MVNKKDLSKKLAKNTLLTQKESLQVVEKLFDIIKEELCNGEDVSVVGFGKFYLYEHAERPVRNPKTQEPMMLDAYKSLRFKSSDIVKNMLKKKHTNK